ncbi:MAG: NAD(P)-dependent oxidoreductase, partial [Nanoarchaeota archaeon]
TFAIILALSRAILPAVERVKQGMFSYRNLEGFDLNGKTIGIIGLGKIGKWVACIAAAFGMNVLAYDIYRDNVFAKKQHISYSSLNYLLQKSDIVSLHCNLTKENRHLLDAKKISLMKKNALLINTARGGLVRTSALLSALRRKKIAGAGLDVLEEEYLPDSQRKKMLKQLTEYSNVIITPHNAFNSTEAVQKIFDVTINTIRRITHALPTENRVI